MGKFTAIHVYCGHKIALKITMQGDWQNIVENVFDRCEVNTM